jgi:D-sedoheptulose 7-phosphate isomerase
VNRVEDIFERSASGRQFADGYLGYLTEILAALDRSAIARFADELLAARERNARIFFLGNGGSAATASHWVSDLTRWRGRPFRALSLTENVAVLTAIANDYGYGHVFRQQLENLMGLGDVVVAISASGNSENVLSAIEYGNANGATTVGLTGFDGGRLSALAQVVVHAPTATGEYGPAEDVHLILDHLVTSYLWQVCAAEERE